MEIKNKINIDRICITATSFSSIWEIMWAINQQGFNQLAQRIANKEFVLQERRGTK